MSKAAYRNTSYLVSLVAELIPNEPLNISMFMGLGYSRILTVE